jgi:4-amino-4-deoxy-L-arabinose transferase-like glycosyltransferase
MSVPKIGKRESFIALGLGVIYLGILFLWANHNGALGIPRNDDGFYLRTSFHFAATGEFVPVSAYPMLFGQTLFSLPVIKIFGENIAALQIFWSSLAVFALIVLYRVFRESFSSMHSAFCVVPLAVGPIFANLSLSHMTDLPAISFQIFGICCMVKSVTSKNRIFIWMIVSLMFISIAFTIRQSSVYLLGAFAAFLLLNRKKLSHVKTSGSILALNCAGLVVFYVWRSGLAHFGNFPIETNWYLNPVSHVRDSILNIGMTYGMYIFPLVLLVNPKLMIKNFGKKGVSISIAVGVAIAFTFFVMRPKPSGNYFSQFVAYQSAKDTSSYDIIYASEWQFIQLIGLITTAAFLIICARWFFLKAKRLISVDSSFSTLSIVLMCLVGFQIFAFHGVGFDRYGILVIPLLGAFLIKCAKDQNVLISGFPVVSLLYGVLLLTWGVRAFDASTNFDGAAWKIAQQQVDSGTSPRAIDGGYSWFAFYQTDFETTETDKFALWFKFRESPDQLTNREKQFTNRICYLTKIGSSSPTEHKVSEINVSGLFGWKTHIELQKLGRCS